jgi:hypothetical protein
MEIVTIAEAWPQYGQEFTISDLDKMPDDGHLPATGRRPP